jgi:hypothetical protein
MADQGVVGGEPDVTTVAMSQAELLPPHTAPVDLSSVGVAEQYSISLVAAAARTFDAESNGMEDDDAMNILDERRDPRGASSLATAARKKYEAESSNAGEEEVLEDEEVVEEEGDVRVANVGAGTVKESSATRMGLSSVGEGIEHDVAKVTWTETLVKVFVALKDAHPMRDSFSDEEIIKYTRRNWSAVCGNRKPYVDWERSGVRRYLRQATRYFAAVEHESLAITWTLTPGALTGETEYKGNQGKTKRKPPRLPNLDNIIFGKRSRVSVADFNHSGAAKGRSNEGNGRPCIEAAPEKHAARRTANRRPASSCAPMNDERPTQATDDDGSKSAVGIYSSSRSNEVYGCDHPTALIPVEWTTVPPGPIRLSDRDRSPAITFIRGPPELNLNLTVRGHKGFRMIRATHGVCEGDWYFEATIMEYEGDGAVRLGWSTRRSDTETPVGFDSQSFGIRDRTGEFVHNAKLRSHGKRFGCGDVIGCRIRLPRLSMHDKKKIERSDYQWLEHRFINFLQGRGPRDTGVTLKDSFVEFFLNGVSFGLSSHFAESVEPAVPGQGLTGVPMGIYFPSIALFRNAVVRANFGPDFRYPPPLESRPMCECAPEPEPVCDTAAVTAPVIEWPMAHPNVPMSMTGLLPGPASSSPPAQEILGCTDATAAPASHGTDAEAETVIRTESRCGEQYMPNGIGIGNGGAGIEGAHAPTSSFDATALEEVDVLDNMLQQSP